MSTPRSSTVTVLSSPLSEPQPTEDAAEQPFGPRRVPSALQRNVEERGGRRVLTPEILLSEGYGLTPPAAHPRAAARPPLEVVQGGIPQDLGEERTTQARSFEARLRALAARLQHGIRENPIRAVGIAAAAGFALSASMIALTSAGALTFGLRRAGRRFAGTQSTGT